MLFTHSTLHNKLNIKNEDRPHGAERKHANLPKHKNKVNFFTNWREESPISPGTEATLSQAVQDLRRPSSQADNQDMQAFNVHIHNAPRLNKTEREKG